MPRLVQVRVYTRIRISVPVRVAVVAAAAAAAALVGYLSIYLNGNNMYSCFTIHHRLHGQQWVHVCVWAVQRVDTLGTRTYAAKFAIFM